MVLSFLPVQGALLAYQCLGTGPFLLTIPGANGDAAIFNEVAPYLAQDFTRHAGLVDFLIAHEPPLAYVLGGAWAEETYSVFEGIYQKFLADGIDAATLGFLGPGAANSTDVETQAAYHALVDPANRGNAELFFGHETAAYTAVNESIPELVGLEDKFVMDIGETCNIPSCDISAILAFEVGVDLYVTPGGHLGYVSEPEGFARQVLSIFAAHGKA
ncbi:hypothetical protein INS49_008861 [Diaporthe citri]|uniref:uncharacterized protein n=1 Tax=Diaporthe citri TaxID=83186 RepID=UPI001C80FD2C|nr:uncharacterized protein INS49_008861 [Diaporthe citri]KAG6363758.1 hypothetical protein INS49_008861 [Diaporthe citri]